MRELSVFVDESGDFVPYEHHSPYQIVTFVFHDQSVDIAKNISHLNGKFSQSGLPATPIHAGPLIRREYEYKNLSLLERKRIFNFLYNFTRTTDITYKVTALLQKSKASTRAKNKYRDKTYDRLELVVPKGKKAEYQDHAEKQGESVNKFICRAVDEAIERDMRSEVK